MRITLLVFSQTGNTLRVAEAMADALERRGHGVLLLRTALFGPDETDLPDADLLLVGSPTFFSRAPTVMREYLEGLPALGGLPAVVFCTSGGASGRTLSDLWRGIERRGARVLGGAVFPGEVRYPVRSLLGRCEGQPRAAELERAAGLAVEAVDAVDSGSAGSAPGTGRALGRGGRGGRSFYGVLGLLLRPSLMRRVLRVPEVDPAVCNRCGWCVGACPARAITLAPVAERHMRPPHGGAAQPAPTIDPAACVRCYRCLECPVGAYRQEWRPGVEAVIGVLYHRGLVARFGDPEARCAGDGG